LSVLAVLSVFFFQAEDGIRDRNVTGVQTCALPIFAPEVPEAAPVLSVPDVPVSVLPASCTVSPVSEADTAIGMPAVTITAAIRRSEERRVGKECRYRLWQCD